jgi:RNA:NAD 2'-phosphotransferase (TPT1/KptA family)
LRVRAPLDEAGRATDELIRSVVSTGRKRRFGLREGAREEGMNLAG